METFRLDIYYPPNIPKSDPKEDNAIQIFLAGSIEQGKAENWQEKLIKDIGTLKLPDSLLQNDSSIPSLTIYNPRRPDWNPNLPQDAMNATLKEQINWELDHLEKADIICLYLDPNTTSPISLLELGLHIRSGKLVVCCPPEFYRNANVDLTCQKYRVNVSNSYQDFYQKLMEKIVAVARK